MKTITIDALKRFMNIAMKTRLLVILLFVSLGVQEAKAQQNFCSLVPNGTFASTNYSGANPFRSGIVNGWSASHGSPVYNSTNPLSNAASPQIEAGYNSFTLDIGSGIRTSDKIYFAKGKKYYIIFNYKNNNGISAQELNVALVADGVWGTGGNTLPVSGLSDFTKIGNSIAVPGSLTSWTKSVVCFTAPYNSADLWFYAKVPATATTPSRIGIDNVEIYEDFDFAGFPKVRYSCDELMHLGLKPVSPCVPINAVPSHTWYVSGSSTPIATTQYLDVQPPATTTYVLVRDNGGCIKTDTVKVVVSHKPVFSLGNDTTLCQCDGITLDPGVRNNCYSYVWGDGYIGVPRTINQNSKPPINSLSQTYTLTIIDNCSGCSSSKSIVLTFKPVPNCQPRTKIYCDGEFPQTISTKGIGTSYSWSWPSGITPPSPPYNAPALNVNSKGQYVCKVTDGSGNCNIGYDTVNVQPWDSIRLKVAANQSYNPCVRTGLYLVNQYDPTTPLKWYHNGVFKQTTDAFFTYSNGTYVGEFISPGGVCVKRDTIKVVFIDPPKIYLSPAYGSFCKNNCDTLLSFNYCDTCGPDMGTVTGIYWSGNGVTKRKIGGVDKFFYCAKSAKCGNNILTASVVYTKYGIVCTTNVSTNAFKVCPLELDSINPLCEGDGDVHIYNQGTKISNAVIIGNGIYQDTATGYFKFSPKLAGAGSHYIKYFYTDNAGCNGWDSIRVMVFGKPRIKLWIGDCVKGNVSWNVLIYASQAEADRYTVESSEWSGSSQYNIKYNLAYATKSFWGSTNGISIPGHTYWFKVTNITGCSDSVGITVGKEKPLNLAYETNGCLSTGINISAFYNTTFIDGTSYPGNLAYQWDDNDTAFISSNLGMDGDLRNILNTIKGNSTFGKLVIEASSAAKHKVFTTGWHKFTMLTEGGCIYTDSILIPFECSNCKDLEVKDIIITSFEKWDNQEKIITGNLIIEAGGNLELNNCMLHFMPCSRIIVKNNFQSTKFSATLTILNSTLDGCSNWKGIEVWGSPDLYDWNAVNINLGDDPRTKLMGSNMRTSNNVNTTHSWAWVYAKNSVIKDADIAIFVGKYDENDNRNYANEDIVGGMAFIDNTLFKNNYVDVVFTPRPGAELISGRYSWNASYVVSCKFDSTRKSTVHCNNMYWFEQNGTTDPGGNKITNLSPECHIVDLTETLYQDKLAPLKFYAFTGNGFGEMLGGTNMVNTTLKRDARIPYTLPHSQYTAHQIPLHLGVYSISQIKSRFQNSISGNNCNNW